MLVWITLDLNHLVAVGGENADVLVGRKGIYGSAHHNANGTRQTKQQGVGGGISQPSLFNIQSKGYVSHVYIWLLLEGQKQICVNRSPQERSIAFLIS